MTTPQSFRDVAEEVLKDSDENVTSSEQEEVSSPQEQEVEETNPEVQEDEEQKPFAQKPELQGKTPEELEQIYKDWNSNYTKTRQREREELREYQNRVAELEQYVQQVQGEGTEVQDPGLQDQRDYVQEQFDLGNMDLNEYTQYMRQIIKEDARSATQEVLQEQYQQDLAQKEEMYQTSAVNEFLEVDERLNQDSPNYNPLMTRTLAQDMSSLLDRHIEQNGSSIGFNSREIASQLVSQYDSYINQQVASRIRNSTQAARAKAGRINQGSITGRTMNSTPTKDRSLRDILGSTIAE